MMGNMMNNMMGGGTGDLLSGLLGGGDLGGTGGAGELEGEVTFGMDVAFNAITLPVQLEMIWMKSKQSSNCSINPNRHTIRICWVSLEPSK